MTVHGGDARIVAEEAGIALSDILDFSANVNPRGLPQRARERLLAETSDRRLLGLYPEPKARHLRSALSKHLEVPVETIVIGPGSEALLGPILRCLSAGRALVPVPAFSEYRRICAREAIEYVRFELLRADCFRLPIDRFRCCIKKGRFDVVVLNNPHNPSGLALQADDVRRLFDAVTAGGGTLLLDEAFVDYIPGASFVREAAVREGLIVLRSLTKLYGCPALRVGYAVALPETIRRVTSFLPTWAVTQLATDALAEAVADQEYVKLSLAENKLERERLHKALGALGLMVFPSAANYLFFELRDAMPSATELRARLIKRHRILVRNCDSYEGLLGGRYVRVAVRTGEENGRLISALREELTLR